MVKSGMTVEQITALERLRADEKLVVKDGKLLKKLNALFDVDVDFQRRAHSAWGEIISDIYNRADAATPPRKSFEVHHEVEAAKDAFLISILDTRNPEMTIVEVRRRLTEPPVIEAEPALEA